MANPGERPGAIGDAVRRFSAWPGIARAAVWMVLTAVGFVAIVGMIRAMSATYHPLEIVFFRNLFGLMAMAPWLWRVGLTGLKPGRPKLFMLRAALSYTAMATWFMAVSIVPMAEAVTLSFTAPLFATILAALVLGEVVRARRWMAVAVGFVGVIVILRPDLAAFDPTFAWPLASALAIASAQIAIKSLSRTESPEAIVVQLGLWVTPFAFVPMLFVWHTPTLIDMVWFAVMGAIGTFAQICLNRALASADASAVVPFDYIRLPMVAAMGYTIFGESVDTMTWGGAAVIILSSIYVTHREQRAARIARNVSKAASGAAARAATSDAIATAPEISDMGQDRRET